MKTTPEVGRSVPFSKAVRTAVGQVMVQAPELVERSLHIKILYVTLLISKLERFRFVMFRQKRNMLLIPVTFEVLKLERSKFVRPVHPLNISLMYITFEVLKLVRSKFVRPEHP